MLYLYIWYKTVDFMTFENIPSTMSDVWVIDCHYNQLFLVAKVLWEQEFTPFHYSLDKNKHIWHCIANRIYFKIYRNFHIIIISTFYVICCDVIFIYLIQTADFMIFENIQSIMSDVWVMEIQAWAELGQAQPILRPALALN